MWFVLIHIFFFLLQVKKTDAELKECVKKLRELAYGLERCHFGTTVASLTGGLIGVAGGVTSIVGLILAPFTLGASLIVTGVGIGVAVLGGATAGVSNITNVVNQSIDRRNVKNIIIKFQENMNSLVCCLEHIGQSRDTSENSTYSDDSNLRIGTDGTKIVQRMGRGLGGIPELVRLTRVLSLGRVAAQTARAVRVAEVLGGVFSAFFIAVDIFFIAMDAKEIHHIRQAREEPTVGTEGYTGLNEGDSESDVTPKQEVKSELMKFVLKIRETADELEKAVDELDIINYISTLESTNENL